MPIYEYRCDNGHSFEELQRMTDEPLSSCATCGAPVARVFHPVAVHFKGSGFYATDYGKKKAPTATDSSPKGDSKESGAKESSSKESSSKDTGSKESSSD
jgi:putative FmdB family regulatory protein